MDKYGYALKQNNNTDMKNNRSKILIRIFIVFIFLSVGCWNIVMRLRTASLMEDIYFQAYDNKNLETIIYKYDVQAETVNEIGRVVGYFHNCKINSEKKYITGVRSPFGPNKDSDFEFGVLRFYLADGTSELMCSEKQLYIGKDASIVWKYTFPYDDGNRICICYKDQDLIYILYDLTTGKAKKIDVSKIESEVHDIRDNHIWYSVGNRLMKYNMKTYERKEVLQDATQYTVSDDGKKIEFFENYVKRIYLYDVVREKKRCILKAGWNKTFSSYSPYSSGWDKSGNYYYYIEYYVKLFSSSDTRIKVYNLHTKKSECIYLHRNAPATTIYEFIRNE